MRSFALAVAVSMLISAVYVIQNMGAITVRFLMFERTFTQGIWVVIVFAASSVIMWFFSLLAGLEQRKNYRMRLQEKDKKIAQLEEEKSSILSAFKYAQPGDVPTGMNPQAEVLVESVPAELHLDDAQFPQKESSTVDTILPS